MNQDIMNAEEAADFLGLSKTVLVKLTREGKIPGVKVGREWRFSEPALKEYKESGENPDSTGLVKLKNRSNKEYPSSPKPEKRKSKIPEPQLNSSFNKNYPNPSTNQNVTNPSNEKTPEKNPKNKSAQIAVNAAIWWGGIGIYALYFTKTHPNAGIWDSFFDPWGWGVVLALGVVQAIVNALFFKNQEI